MSSVEARDVHSTLVVSGTALADDPSRARPSCRGATLYARTSHMRSLQNRLLEWETAKHDGERRRDGSTELWIGNCILSNVSAPYINLSSITRCSTVSIKSRSSSGCSCSFCTSSCMYAVCWEVCSESGRLIWFQTTRNKYLEVTIDCCLWSRFTRLHSNAEGLFDRWSLTVPNYISQNCSLPFVYCLRLA